MALRARRKAFYAVLGATIAVAIAVALIVPKNYVASTTILIDGRDEQQLGAADRMSPRERAGYLQTQLDLIASGRVAKRVVRDLKIAQRPGVREQFERDTGGMGTLEDWAASELLKKVKADAAASNVITVTFGSPDAKYSAEVANAFAKAYQQTALELKTEPTKEATAWFEEQLKSLRQNVSQAQGKLTAYQKEKGITSVEERADIESTRLAELSGQMLRAREATYDATARYKNASEFMSNASAGASADQLPEVMANGAVMAVKAALVAAESRLEQSANDLGPNHPAYQRNLAEVEGLRKKLASEMKKVVAGLSNTAQQSRRREEELRAAYQAQTERLLSMRDARVGLAVLSRDVENAQRTYDTALQKWLTMKVDSRALMTNIAVLSPAIEPLEPKSPRVGLITGLSILVGTMLAGGVVFLLETLDRRVRSRGDLEQRLAVPSLGRLSKWTPAAGRLLAAPQLARAPRAALPHPW
jgi:chain length determinant protein EpsF